MRAHGTGAGEADDASMRRLLPFLILLVLVIALSIGGVMQSDAATAEPAAEVALTGVTQVSGGQDFTCARRTDGTARCWGANQQGQAGVDDPQSVIIGPPVVGPDGGTLTGVRQVSAGQSHACAVLVSTE